MTSEQKGKDNKGLAKSSRKIVIQIPESLSKDMIKLIKLEDGYRVHAAHKQSKKDNKETIETSLVYESEEHYGIPVKEVTGDFNEDGSYEVNIVFDQE
ncbi:hypothetical protein GINT2_001613 [Glugoides intestinalis]